MSVVLTSSPHRAWSRFNFQLSFAHPLEASCTLQDAIARVEDPLRYDAVLFDLHLQGGDALSELTQLGELDGGPAVIMMGDEERCRKAFPAADAYVVKDQDYLVRLPVVVQEALSRRPESVVSREAPALTGTVSNASEMNNRREVRETAAVANWPRLAQEWGVERERLETVLQDSEARYEAQAKDWAKERDELAQALQAAERRAEELAQAQPPSGTVLGDSEARYEAQAKDWAKERDKLTQALQAAERRAEELAQAQGPSGTALRDSEAQYEAQAKAWAKERDKLTQALQAAERRAEELAQAQGPGGAALRDSEARHEAAGQGMGEGAR